MHLVCPDVSLERRGPSDVFRARGCGRQHLYQLRLSDTRRTSEEPNTVVDTFFVSFGAIDTAPPAQSSFVYLVAVNAQGAKDLECPREQVTPEIKSIGRGASMMIAEGCGKRATYVLGEASGGPLCLTAKVAPEAPSGFAAWDGSD